MWDSNPYHKFFCISFSSAFSLDKACHHFWHEPSKRKKFSVCNEDYISNDVSVFKNNTLLTGQGITMTLTLSADCQNK